MRWLALVAGFIALIAGSLGCATMAATSAADNHTDFYNKPVLSDEIIAIGRPDASLSKSIGQPDAVAFIGQKNTYLLYKGGEELEKIAQMKLDGRLLHIDPARNHQLYLKDKQVWGDLVLTYGEGTTIPAAEQPELEQGGFSLQGSGKYARYQKMVAIEGLIYPPIKLSDAQLSKLAMHRPFSLYNPRDAKPPMNVGATLMIPVAVVADIVLIPVYLGVAVIVLVANH